MKQDTWEEVFDRTMLNRATGDILLPTIGGAGNSPRQGNAKYVKSFIREIVRNIHNNTIKELLEKIEDDINSVDEVKVLLKDSLMKD